jgi:C-terminal processing protease CtpA/Prc
MKIEETGPPDGFDPCEWVFYEITREVKPSDPYCFDGRLYVLADRGSGSATETYADAVKRTGLGTIVGQRTAGGLGGYFMADTVRLPASGMIFRLEADLDINPDGSFQELAGTKPDVELPPCDLPEKSTKEELLKDAWIRKVIEEL